MSDPSQGDRPTTSSDEPEVESVPTDWPEYTFESTQVELAAELVDVAFAAFDDFSAAPTIDAAGRAAGLEGTALIRELWQIASYHLRREPGGKPGCDLGRYGSDASDHWPLPIRRVSDESVLLWRALAPVVGSPAAIARMDDLLFVRGDGNGRDHATRAIENYLLAVDSISQLPAPELKDHELHAGSMLLRAWSLARSVRLVTEEAEVRQRLANVAEQVLAARDAASHPGLSLPAIRALADGPMDRHSADPIDVDDLLVRAAAVYRKDYLARQIADDRRRRARGDAVALKAIAMDEVEACIEYAEAAPDAGSKMILLNGAARVATDRGLTDVARKIAAMMQRIPPSSLGMQSIEVSVPIPPFIRESFLIDFTRHGTWRDAIGYFFSTFVPSGSVTNLRSSVGDSESVFTRLLRPVMFGAGGMPRATATSDEASDAHEMSSAASVSATNVGWWLAEGLRRIADQYGVPDEDDLTRAILDAGARDPRLARSLAAAFRHFWAGDYESCVDVIVPKFEAAARSLLRELDEGIYRVEVGNDPGGYVGLHTLLEHLETLALDESWAYFFRWLFLGPYGANIRNDVAHGFLFNPGPAYSALTLRAVSIVILTAEYFPSALDDSEPDPLTPRDRETVLRLLREPIGPRSRAEQVISAAADRLERTAWRLRVAQVRAGRRYGGRTQRR